MAGLSGLTTTVLGERLEVRAGRSGPGEPGQDEGEPARCYSAIFKGPPWLPLIMVLCGALVFWKR